MFYAELKKKKHKKKKKKKKEAFLPCTLTAHGDKPYILIYFLYR